MDQNKDQGRTSEDQSKEKQKDETAEPEVTETDQTAAADPEIQKHPGDPKKVPGPEYPL